MRLCSATFLISILVLGTPLSFAEDGIDLEKGRQFWAFKSPLKPPPPKVQDASWPRSPIDQFSLARLESNKAKPPSDLEKTALVRRAYFDLHGLPPTPQQIDQFLADDSPEAFEKLVDTLLASPHFGERWGRHWLDVVRFAESTGGGRTMLLEHSWRYRDYVVDSFNSDKPYDQFVTEQLAGDLLPNKDTKTQREQLIATTFLALGPSNYELQDKELLRMEIIDEQVDTVGRAFMAMTLGCARCHDHMFDPISARDYYALAGIFHSTKTVEHSNVSKWLLADLPPMTSGEKKSIEAHRDYRERLKKAMDGIAAAEKELSQFKDPVLTQGIVVDNTNKSATSTGKWVESTSVQKWVGAGYIHDDTGDKSLRAVTYQPNLEEGGRYEVRVSYSAGPNRATNTPITIKHAGGEKTVKVNQRKAPKIGKLFQSVGIYEFSAGRSGSVTISNTDADGITIADAVQWLPLDGVEAEVATADKAKQEALEKRVAAMHKELKKLSKTEPKLKPIKTMTVRDEAKPGDTHLSIRGDVHSPGEIVPRGVPEVIQIGYRPSFSGDKSGRLELARWLVSPDHPLTARVMANRIWMHLMGEGLVRTPDNFGKMGEAPTDPELLDWLALRLIDNDWSVKKTVRDIMLSRTYQTEREEPRRLDAEAMRDAILLASGQLDTRMGGSTIKPGTKSEFGYKFDSDRRSLYLPVFRNSLPDLFDVFDFPDPNLVAGKRNTSTLPTQALYFMNHPFVIEQSKHAAEKLMKTPNLHPRFRIKLSYRKTLGRLPSDRELALAEKFLGDDPELEDWSAFYQSLFACIDFRYVK